MHRGSFNPIVISQGMVFAMVFAGGLSAGLLARDRLTLQTDAASALPRSVPETRSPPTAGAAQPMPGLGAYAAEIIRIIDGDTVEARVAVWLGHDLITKIRLRGIDAPEIKGACGAEREKAIAARDALAALVGKGTVTLTDIGPDKYFGRVVARLRIADGRDAGAILVTEGLARPYDGRRRDMWCTLP